MKIARLIIFVFPLYFFQISCAQQKSFNCANCTPVEKKITEKLKKLDFKKYFDKSVAVFLKDVGYEYRNFVPMMKKPGYIDRISFEFSDSLTIEIRVKDLAQDKPLNSGYTLNINEFKAKKISMICFRYGGRCIKGCEDEFCY